MSMPETPILRVLALDGGGVRGLSSLLLLPEIMENIERETGADETPLPCQYFNLIGGTSTGGLIAIMLGRLEMVNTLYNTADYRVWMNVSRPTWRSQKRFSELITFLRGKSR